ncbi:MAG: methyl-accepting chemotaxis protein [Lachnospiraceae bacterium]|nr:methyl-accepting chemotaxis protein [Lachnospiraceae bacterium]
MKRKKKLVLDIMLPAIIGAIIIAVILTAVGAVEIRKTYLTMISEELSATAYHLYDELMNEYAGDWGLNEQGALMKGPLSVGKKLQEQLDEIHSHTNIDYTIFIGKTRILTTLMRKGTNERIVGTDASDAVVAAVLNGGNEYLAENIKIEGNTYYGYYLPLKNSDGSIVGMLFTGRHSEDLNAHIRSVCILMVVIALVLVLVMLGIAMYLIKVNSVTVNSIVNTLSELADGNLGVEIDDKILARKDELGTIAEKTRDLDEKLIDIISTTKSLSERVSKSGDELSMSANQAAEASSQVTEAVDEISKGAVSQAESVQNAAADTSRMGVDIEGITDGVQELNGFTGSMDTSCENAMQALNLLLKQNTNTVNSMKVIDDQIHSTNDAVRNIAEASDLITNIAEQTNLLALNASIEAARAGEAGKGFAVVATEIGSLANQSQEATVKINDIVNKLIEESAKSVQTIEDLNKAFELQNKQLDSTKNDMTSMEEGVGHVTDSSNDIDAKVGHLNTAKNDLISIIDDLSAISEQNAASAEETNASMQELHATFEVISHEAVELQELAKELNEEMEYFKI